MREKKRKMKFRGRFSTNHILIYIYTKLSDEKIKNGFIRQLDDLRGLMLRRVEALKKFYENTHSFFFLVFPIHSLINKFWFFCKSYLNLSCIKSVIWHMLLTFFKDQLASWTVILFCLAMLLKMLFIVCYDSNVLQSENHFLKFFFIWMYFSDLQSV